MNRESEFGMPSQRRGREMKCGNCAYHVRGDNKYGGFDCMNDISDFYLDETDYNFGCINFEPKKEQN